MDACNILLRSLLLYSNIAALNLSAAKFYKLICARNSEVYRQNQGHTGKKGNLEAKWANPGVYSCKEKQVKPLQSLGFLC